jgi:hypothetical protein
MKISSYLELYKWGEGLHVNCYSLIKTERCILFFIFVFGLWINENIKNQQPISI